MRVRGCISSDGGLVVAAMGKCLVFRNKLDKTDFVALEVVDMCVSCRGSDDVLVGGAISVHASSMWE